MIVNLARALYSDAEIVILDDPLSAVDAHVAEKLFADAIMDLKQRGKTVVLVTHALHFLSRVDHIYCLSEGRVREEGSYEELIESGSVFANLMRDFGNDHSGKKESADGEEGDEKDEVEEIMEEAGAGSGEAPKKKGGKQDRGAAEGTGKEEGFLIVKETRKTGHISGAGELFGCSIYVPRLMRRFQFTAVTSSPAVVSLSLPSLWALPRSCKVCLLMAFRAYAHLLIW